MHKVKQYYQDRDKLLVERYQQRHHQQESVSVLAMLKHSEMQGFFVSDALRRFRRQAVTKAYQAEAPDDLAVSLGVYEYACFFNVIPPIQDESPQTLFFMRQWQGRFTNLESAFKIESLMTGERNIDQVKKNYEKVERLIKGFALVVERLYQTLLEALWEEEGISYFWLYYGCCCRSRSDLEKGVSALQWKHLEEINIKGMLEKLADVKKYHLQWLDQLSTGNMEMRDLSAPSQEITPVFYRYPEVEEKIDDKETEMQKRKKGKRKVRFADEEIAALLPGDHLFDGSPGL